MASTLSPLPGFAQNAIPESLKPYLLDRFGQARQFLPNGPPVKAVGVLLFDSRMADPWDPTAIWGFVKLTTPFQIGAYCSQYDSSDDILGILNDTVTGLTSTPPTGTGVPTGNSLSLPSSVDTSPDINPPFTYFPASVNAGSVVGEGFYHVKGNGTLNQNVPFGCYGTGTYESFWDVLIAQMWINSPTAGSVQTLGTNISRNAVVKYGASPPEAGDVSWSVGFTYTTSGGVGPYSASDKFKTTAGNSISRNNVGRGGQVTVNATGANSGPVTPPLQY